MDVTYFSFILGLGGAGAWWGSPSHTERGTKGRPWPAQEPQGSIIVCPTATSCARSMPKTDGSLRGNCALTPEAAWDSK